MIFCTVKQLLVKLKPPEMQNALEYSYGAAKHFVGEGMVWDFTHGQIPLRR